MPCENSEWSMVLLNQGTTETLGLSWVRRRAVTQKAPIWGRGHGGNGEPKAMLSE
jgi:hypothetical protein